MSPHSSRSLLFLVILLLALMQCTPKNAPDPFKQTLTHWQMRPDLPDSIKHPWLPVRLPTTVFAGLRQNGQFEDVFVDKNLEKVERTLFERSWYYRTSFSLPNLQELPYVSLRFNGLNYRANIWLNGLQIASADTAFGAFRVFQFDVSSLVQEKNNRLLVQIFPPQKGDFTIGFVDWNPPPPDKNMGIWRPVELILSRAVRLEQPFVKTKLDSSLTQAQLTVQVKVHNLSARPVDGLLLGRISSITFEKPYIWKPDNKKFYN